MPLGVPVGIMTLPVLGSIRGVVALVGVAVWIVTLATVAGLVPMLSLVSTLLVVV